MSSHLGHFMRIGVLLSVQMALLILQDSVSPVMVKSLIVNGAATVLPSVQNVDKIMPKSIY
jgi:hypothetical protein